MTICFISNKYPGAHNQSDYTFVKQLVDAIAEEGNECYVIAPYSVNHYRKFVRSKEQYAVGKGIVRVFRPWYLSFSSLSFLQGVSAFSRRRSLRRAFRMLPSVPDVVYGHFWQQAYEGFDYARDHNLPLFVATGESVVSLSVDKGADREAFCDYVRGVICVSSRNLEESIKLGLATADKCAVFPNSIDNGLFHRRDRQECRRQLNLPSDSIIAAFVGGFIERKGPKRMAKALEMSGGVRSIFIGKGDQLPQCDGILFRGALPHEKIPVYLSAADFFMLPTLNEGCCNAIVEALACGLPVISSNMPFNWDILDETNSIMVDPTDTAEMALAIARLRDDKGLRARLSDGAIRKAETLTIDQRAKNILRFIKERMA